MAMRLRGGNGVGTPAPALELPAATGERRSLREFQGRPVMLSFLGPANCAFCRAHVIRTIQARDEFAALGANVVLVAYHDPELVMTRMMRDLDLPYLLLVDSTREAYVQWGLGRPTLRSYFSPSVYIELAQILRRREPSLGKLPDVNQLGGDFVIDADGQLAFVNRMRTVNDRAPIPALLSALKSCIPTG